MDFRGPDELDFEEVDRRYAHLKQRHEARNITDQEFHEQLKRLMVQDQRGRWWSKSRTTGEWHYHDGSAWVKGIPPGAEPKFPQAPSTLGPTPQATRPTPGLTQQETPPTPGPTQQETPSTEERRQRHVSNYRPPVEQQARRRRKEVRTLLMTVLVLAAVIGGLYFVNRASQSGIEPTVEPGWQKQQPAKVDKNAFDQAPAKVDKNALDQAPAKVDKNALDPINEPAPETTNGLLKPSSQSAAEPLKH